MISGTSSARASDSQKRSEPQGVCFRNPPAAPHIPHEKNVSVTTITTCSGETFRFNDKNKQEVIDDIKARLYKSH